MVFREKGLRMLPKKKSPIGELNKINKFRSMSVLDWQFSFSKRIMIKNSNRSMGKKLGKTMYGQFSFKVTLPCRNQLIKCCSLPSRHPRSLTCADSGILIHQILLRRRPPFYANEFRETGTGWKKDFFKIQYLADS